MKQTISLLLCLVLLLSALPFSVGAESEKLQLTQWQAQTQVASWVGVTNSSVSPEDGGNSLKITAVQWQFVYTAVRLKANANYRFDFLYKGTTPIGSVHCYTQKSGMKKENNNSGGYLPGRDENNALYPDLVTSFTVEKQTNNSTWNKGSALLQTGADTEYYIILKFNGKAADATADEVYLANAALFGITPVTVKYLDEGARLTTVAGTPFAESFLGATTEFTVEKAQSAAVTVQYGGKELTPNEKGIYSVKNNGSSELSVETSNNPYLQKHEAGKTVDGKDLTAYREEVHQSSIWQGNTVYHESVMFYNSSDGRVSLTKKLLYPIEKIVSVRSSDLKTNYVIGVDFTVENGKLVWLPGGKCPIYTGPLTVPQNTPDDYKDPELADHGSVSTAKYYKTDDENGLCLLYDAYHEQHTVYVSYTHQKTWAELDGSAGYHGKAPEAQGSKLSGLYQKLQSRSPLNVLVYGDSVATGCSSSGANMNYDLFDTDCKVQRRGAGWGARVPTFFEQATARLTTLYGKQNGVTYYNLARGGMSSRWGAEHLGERIKAMNSYYGKTVTPDLIYVLYFSNDTQRETAQYRADMNSITTQLRTQYPNAAIVLLSGKMDNKRCNIYGDIAHQQEMEQALVEIAAQTENCITLPAFSQWISITGAKDVEDYLSNNINHANDWWATMTAQMLVAAMQRPEDRYVPGDVNSDGSVNLKDVVQLVQHTLGGSNTINSRAADCNGDGTIDLKDAAYLAQHLAGYQNRPLPGTPAAEPVREVEIDVGEVD